MAEPHTDTIPAVARLLEGWEETMVELNDFCATKGIAPLETGDRDGKIIQVGTKACKDVVGGLVTIKSTVAKINQTSTSIVGRGLRFTPGLAVGGGGTSSRAVVQARILDRQDSRTGNYILEEDRRRIRAGLGLPDELPENKHVRSVELLGFPSITFVRTGGKNKQLRPIAHDLKAKLGTMSGHIVLGELSTVELPV